MEGKIPDSLEFSGINLDYKSEISETYPCTITIVYGNWSCIAIDIILNRRSWKHVVENIAPPGAIVMISWVSCVYVFTIVVSTGGQL